MAAKQIQEGDKIITNIQKWRADNYVDLAGLTDANMGDTAYVFADSDTAKRGVYILSTGGTWVKQ